MVSYVVGVVVAVNVMRILFFLVLDVSMLRECEGDSNAGMENRGGVVAMSTMNEYVGRSHGSDIVSTAVDVLGMSVVLGMGGVCMFGSGWCGSCGAESIRGLDLGVSNPEERLGVLDVCLCLGYGGVGGIGGK